MCLCAVFTVLCVCAVCVARACVCVFGAFWPFLYVTQACYPKQAGGKWGILCIHIVFLFWGLLCKGCSIYVSLFLVASLSQAGSSISVSLTNE